MLTALSYIFWVAIALGILVFVHELGHFLFARLFGMRVDAFSLGFPPNIIAKQVGETEYRLGAIPLGGYVKIAGMIDESLDTETMTESEPAPDEYRAKPVWQRMLVISGGVIFNVIFAWMVYTGLNLAYGERSTPPDDIPFEVTEGSVADEIGIQSGDRVVAINGEPLERIEDLPTAFLAGGESVDLTVVRGVDTVRVASEVEQPMTRITRAQNEAEQAGEPVNFYSAFGLVPRTPTLIGTVSPGSAADEAGILPGDRVIQAGGRAVGDWDALTEQINGSDGEPLALVVEREGQPVEITAQPREAGEGYRLGVGSSTMMGTQVRDLGFGESARLGVTQTSGMIGMYFGFVGKLVTGRESFRENVGGPVMIAKQAKEAADIGGIAFWNIVATLSIALAVFNILPIPVLDGGHLVFLGYEAIARREPSLAFRIRVQQVGMVALLTLMVFVIFNDAIRIFG
ncbi:MAG: RIP metalloprotease RseP [Bacteroidota bacterium]